MIKHNDMTNNKLQELDVLIKSVPYYNEMVDEAYNWISTTRENAFHKECDRLVELYKKNYQNPYSRLYGGISSEVQAEARNNVDRKFDQAEKQYGIDKKKIRIVIANRLVECFPDLKPTKESELYQEDDE